MAKTYSTRLVTNVKKPVPGAKLHADKNRKSLQRALGQRIALCRKTKGLSQEALADICGIHRSHMGQIERGESNVTMATLLTICGTLEVTISRLFKGIA